MKKLYKIYCKTEIALAAAGFFAIIVLTFGNAVLRLFNRPIVANDDICALLFAWVSFMGADIALRSNRLVGMEILTMESSDPYSEGSSTDRLYYHDGYHGNVRLQGTGLCKAELARDF